MNMPFPSREQVESIRKNYPPGTRIVLNSMNDPYSPAEPGTRGSVRYVDDAGQLGVAWDNGRSLTLVPGLDSYRMIPLRIDTFTVGALGTIPHNSQCLKMVPFRFDNIAVVDMNHRLRRRHFTNIVQVGCQSFGIGAVL